MIKRKFGWINVDVPIIGQGTWMIEENQKHNARDIAVKSLQLGLDLGMTHVDTAEMYGNGTVEEIVGEVIKERREEVFLVSKVLPSNASYEGTLKACERSLRRLKTDWLDLYLIHWPSSDYPIKETLRAMEKLVKEGKIRYIGVSNFDLGDLREAENSLREETIACNQVLYNLNSRGIERKLLPYCNSKRIAVVGYSPFGHGSILHLKRNEVNLLIDIAEHHQKTPYQVILNFIVNYVGIFTIPKSNNPSRVKENSESTRWNLTDAEIAKINKIFPVPAYDSTLEVI